MKTSKPLRTAFADRELGFLLDKILECSSLAIYTLDSSYCYTRFNSNYAKMMKAVHNVDIESGKNIFNDLTNEAEKEKLRHSFERVLKGETVIEESDLGKATHSKIYLKTAYHPLKDNEETITGILVLSEDMTAQDAVRKELLEDEENYRRLMELSPDAIAIHQNGKFVYVNSAGANLIGAKDPKELIGKPLLDVIHPDYRPIVRERAQKTTQGFVSTLMEEKFVRLDGAIIDVDVVAIPCTFHGKPAVQVVVRDTTEHKSALHELKESEEKFRQVFEYSPLGISLTTLDGTVRANKAFCDILGYSEQELNTTKWQELTHPDDISENNDLIQAILDGRQIYGRIQKRFIHKNGSLIWTDVSTTMQRDKEGKPAFFITMISNITERKEAEQALRDSDEEKRALLASMRDVILVLDSNGTYLKIAPTDPSLLYKPAPDLIGKNVRDIFSPDKAEFFLHHIKQTVATHHTQHVEYSLPIGDKEIWFSGSVSPMGSDHVIWIGRDITESKRAKQALIDREFWLTESQRVGRIGSYDLDIKSGVWTSSEILDDIFGIEHNAEKTLASWNDLVHPDSRDEMLKYFLNDVVLARKPFSKEYKIVRVCDNQDRWLLGRGELSYDESGNPIRMIGTIQDITERKLAELALQEAHDQLSATLNAIPDLLFELNPDLRICNYHAPTHELLYISPDRFLGKRFDEVLPPDVNKIIAAALEETRQQGWHRGGTYSLDLPSGRHWFELSISTKGEIGNPASHFLVMVRDITERTLAEQALQKSEERYHSLFDRMMDGVYQSTHEGRFIDINQAMVKMFGYDSKEEMLNVDIKKELYFSPEERGSHILDTGQEGTEIYLMRRKDGSGIWVEDHGRYVHDEKGNIIYHEGILRDVTERITTEEILNRVNQAVHSSGEVILMGDLKGIITFVNPAFTHLYGYEPEEVVGKVTPRIFDTPGMDRQKHSNFWQTILNKQTYLAEYENVAKDGKIIPVEVSANPILDSSGNVTGYLSIHRDLTTRKQAEKEYRDLEQKLIQSQKLESIGTLAGGIAHDFNNILAIILAYSGFLQRSNPNNEILKKNLKIIDGAVERGAALVKQILTFARKAESTFGALDVNIMIKEHAKLISETFSKIISIKVDLDISAPPIIADPTQLHQALMNLCVNARDAMPNGGVLTLRTKVVEQNVVSKQFPEASEEKYLNICIEDSGIGIDPEIIKRIFDPFFTTKDQGKGTGLGLAVVYGIMKSHRGHIDVVSEKGIGTTFRLYFPIPQNINEQQSLQFTSSYVPTGGHETILFVEDERILRNLVTDMLRLNGYSVITAFDGEHALQMYEKHKDKIKLIFTDMGLPKVTGEQLFYQLKQKNSALKLVFATGFIEPDKKTELINAGAFDIITKPYKQHQVLKTIRDALDKA